ncbi:hypothetical protein [Lapillicoccus jejuensis]|uniref:Uncharacterized protein n=1 Tax=Lapillicoccus jejuensis TaxID=402171 RepID=A0A542E5Y9_9MICO|nr:hypothetical protein [Lapillicoccus jejuensis]TQJ10747.1 hypothetical protein FB458_3883 [Lapillicoccus jejuensis]
MPVEPPINYREAGELLRRGWSRRRIAQRYGVTPSVIGVAIQRGHIRVPVRVSVTRRAPWDPPTRVHQPPAVVLPEPPTGRRLRHLHVVPDLD